MTPVQDSSSRGRVRLWLAVAAVAVLYAAALAVLRPYLPGTLGSVDAAAKIWQAESLLAGHAELTYPARALDPEGRFLPDWYVFRAGGRPYSVYLNPFAWLMAAGLRLAGPAAYHLVPLACAIAAVWLTARMARRRNIVADEDMWMLVLVIGACTPVFYYAFMPLEHTLAAALAAGAFLLASGATERARSKGAPLGWARLAASGACLALAALSRGECWLLAPAMGLAVMAVFLGAGWKRSLGAGAAMAAGGAVVLGIYLALNPIAFQTQTALAGQFNRIPVHVRFWRLLGGVHPGDRLTGMIGETAAEWISAVGGAALLLATALAALAGTRRSWLRHLATALFALGLAVALVSWRLEGLFAACPFVALVAFFGRKGTGAFSPGTGSFSRLREKVPVPFFGEKEPVPGPFFALVLGTSALYVALCGLLLPNAGASQFSPRFLLPVVPALAVAVLGLALDRARAQPSRWLAVMLALMLLSAFVTEAKGILLLRRAGEFSRITQLELERLPKPFVIFSPRLSQEFSLYRAPKMFLSAPALEAKDETSLGEIVALLREKGIAEFTVLTADWKADERREWLARAGATVTSTRPLPIRGRALVVKTGPD